MMVGKFVPQPSTEYDQCSTIAIVLQVALPTKTLNI